MSTVIRPEVSKKNRYWISKHRHYELKHFCLQYADWKKTYSYLDGNTVAATNLERLPSGNEVGDPTADFALQKAYYLERIKLIEKTAEEADKYLSDYILKAVTEGISYTCLKFKMEIPCGRDMFYDRYRRFFWLLSKMRD